MPPIRPLTKITEKYGRVTPGKGRELEEGLRNPKKSWLEETSAAGDAYAAGVTEAVADGRFVKGVNEAGQSAYLDPALKLGVSRYRAGVEFGVSKYGRKFAKFRDIIEGTTLPPRGATGDPGNMARAEQMAAALHAGKVG